MNPLLPDKSLLFGKEGFPFFKKLEVNDGVYNPETRQFARVLSWEASSCEVEVTSQFCETKDFLTLVIVNQILVLSLPGFGVLLLFSLLTLTRIVDF